MSSMRWSLELMSTILIGQVHPARDDPFDVFTVRAAVKAEDATRPRGRQRMQACVSELISPAQESCAGGMGRICTLWPVGEVDGCAL